MLRTPVDNVSGDKVAESAGEVREDPRPLISR